MGAAKVVDESAGEDGQAPLSVVVRDPAFAVSHNLNGQKLGRKGRDTRERILTAAASIFEGTEDVPVSMSEVARRASLGMTSLYNYFADLTELLLAVLEPVIATADSSYLQHLRDYWPDDELFDRCRAFVMAYHTFWARHSRLLHLRNSMSDQFDERMFKHRIATTQPIIELLVAQMTRSGGKMPAAAPQMASMTMIGVERAVTIATDDRLTSIFGWAPKTDHYRFIDPGARMMELAIRDMRERTA